MDAQRQRQAAERLLALHRDPAGFILPNAWDAGSAIVLASEGFAAIATTSAGIAFSLGKQDYQVADARFGLDREAMLARAAEIVRAVRVPVSADLEAGFGDAPEAVAETVLLAAAAGLAGGNIEDKPPGVDGLYDEELAVARISAARAAIEASGGAFVLNARTDAFLVGAPDALETAVRRANRYLAAGADCLFVPGATDVATARVLAERIAGPVNLVVGLGEASADARALMAAGVRRITVGGSIARASLALVQRAARELRETGTVTYAEGQMSGGEFGRLVAAAGGRGGGVSMADHGATRVAMTPEPPYYAVTTTTELSNAFEAKAYFELGQRVYARASALDDFLGLEAFFENGASIAVSYWRNREAIDAWRRDALHMQAKGRAKAAWFGRTMTRVALVEAAYGFNLDGPDEAAHAVSAGDQTGS